MYWFRTIQLLRVGVLHGPAIDADGIKAASKIKEHVRFRNYSSVPTDGAVILSVADGIQHFLIQPPASGQTLLCAAPIMRHTTKASSGVGYPISAK